MEGSRMRSELVDVYRANVKGSGDRTACSRCQKNTYPKCTKGWKAYKNKECKPGCPMPCKDAKDARGGKASKGGKNDKGGKPSCKKGAAGDGSLDEVGDAAKEHCEKCCEVFGEYVREVLKLIWCVTGSSTPRDGDTRLSEVFCRLMEATYAVGKDAYCLVRALIDHICVCMKKS